MTDPEEMNFKELDQEFYDQWDQINSIMQKIRSRLTEVSKITAPSGYTFFSISLEYGCADVVYRTDGGAELRCVVCPPAYEGLCLSILETSPSLFAWTLKKEIENTIPKLESKTTDREAK